MNDEKIIEGLEAVRESLTEWDNPVYGKQIVDDAIARIRETGWRPIGEAPKDTLLQLWSPSTHTYPVHGRFWAQDSGWFEDNSGDGIAPTHFMPLPAPPAQESSDE